MDAHLTRPAGRSTLGRVLAVWLLFLTVGIALLGSTGTRIKIPNACSGLGLRCINPYEMLRYEQARFVLGPGGEVA